MKTQNLIAAEKQTFKTTCCYCGVGCGVVATAEDGAVTAVAGDKEHPANHGRLCVKGSALHETQDFSDRLQQPLVDGQPSDWDSALELGASKFKQVIEEHGPDSVAFYLSGQLLTEDYYVANKLMKGFVGSANVDTNSRLCMASAVAAHKRAFGEDLVPGCYQDLEETDLILLVGSNMAYTHPVVYQRIAQAKKERPELTVVVLDPRRTPTCDLADIHLPLRPGADAFFFSGLLSYLAAENRLDQTFIDNHCDRFEQTLNAARAQANTPRQSATLCDVDEAKLTQIYRLFAERDKAVTVFSQGINQSSSGVDKGNAIINCHLASGKIGRPGAAPFSITGQPNAMGGREVGGLANQLAAHMSFDNPAHIDRVGRFWNAPRMAQKEGLKAVDMFQTIHSGKIKAIWIMATNPVVTMPEADFVRSALRKCELVMVSDCVGNTDTAREADIVFPATTWGEKTGTVTNSERCISLQRGFLPAPGAARHDWQIIADFAQRLGFSKGFGYQSAADIFREHAALSGFENHGERAFDISALEAISDDEFYNLAPCYWPLPKQGKSLLPKSDKNPQSKGQLRLFTDGHFFTANGRAQFVPITARFPQKPPADGQLIMNTGRVRDQWHTMGRTASSAKLVGHMDEPYVDIHPQDAQKRGLSSGDLVRLENRQAVFLGRAQVTDAVRRGEIFVPMHWNDRYASSSRTDALVNAITDPLCGQPEFKHTPVQASAYPAKWQGFLLTSQMLRPDCEYWSQIRLQQGYKYRLADSHAPEDWGQWLRRQFPEVEQWSELLDSSGANYRAVGFRGDVPLVQLVIAADNTQSRENRWLESHLGKIADRATRFALLAGSAVDDQEDEGKIICSCYEVGEKTITCEIRMGCNSAEKLGAALKCGTNCGSCIPELNELIAQTDTKALTS